MVETGIGSAPIRDRLADEDSGIATPPWQRWFGQVTAKAGTGGGGGPGIQGATGIKGNDGIRGGTGIQGSQGLIGGTGIQGETGLTGGTGIQGVTGIALGQTGIQGVTGLTGGTGVQGGTGLANFLTSADLPMSTPTMIPSLLWSVEKEALYAGVTGVVWVQISSGALQGGTGFCGQTGIQGVTGFVGGTGVQGVTGLVGGTGIQGVTGLIGGTGVQGVTGIGSNVRVVSWIINNPVAGEIPGPKMMEAGILARINSFVSAATSVSFNLYDRTNVSQTGMALMTSDLTSVVTDSSVTAFSSSSLPANSWLWLKIDATSGTPSCLSVSAAYLV